MESERNAAEASEVDKVPSSPRRLQVKCTISSTTVVHPPKKSTSTSGSEANDSAAADDDDDDDDVTESDDDEQNIKSRQVPKRQRKVFVKVEKKPYNPEDMNFDVDNDVFQDCFTFPEKSRDDPSRRADDDVEEPVQQEFTKDDVEAETEDIIKLLEEMDKQGEHAEEVKPEVDRKPISSGGESSPPAHTEEEPAPSGDVPVDNDFTRLENWENEPTEWWTNTKKTPDFEVWMKPMKDGTITRVSVPFIDVPYKDVVRLVSDLGYRRQWDKTFSRIEVLSSDGSSKVLHCTLTTLSKRYDLNLATMDKTDNEAPSYITAWRRHGIANENTTNKRQSRILEFDTRTCGIIIRPAENKAEDIGTRLSILCQLTGPTDPMIKKTYLAGDPYKWLKNLQKYYEHEKKQRQFKVIKL